MQHPLRARIIPALSLVALLLLPSGVSAGTVGREFWVGGGAGWPEEKEKAGANIRGGAQLVFARHFTLGASGLVDSDRYYYFADTSIIFPPLGMYELYGRFQVGRRDDTDDTAMGWVAGIRLGENNFRVFAEGYGIFEPADNYGVCVGISF